MKKELKKAIESKPLYWSNCDCCYWIFDFKHDGKWVEFVEFGDAGTLKSCIYDGQEIIF